MSNSKVHIPVLVNETIDSLKIKESGIYVDATLGMGGYSQAILNSCHCRLIAIDRDPDSISNSIKLKNKFGERFTPIKGLFSDLKNILAFLGISEINGITFDYGVSSPQIDNSTRGFSFRKDGPLDMRMSKSGMSAEEFLNQSDEKIIFQALKFFGEEKKAKRIASAIIKSRPLKTTLEFANVIYSILGRPRHNEIDPATRSFQAVRIAVNDELNEISKGLESSLNIMAPGSRIAAVSFHSLEDKIVKNFFRKNSDLESNTNRHLPLSEKKEKSLKHVTRKPIRPSNLEIQRNPRARSAKLRVAERTKYFTSNPENYRYEAA